MDVNLPEHLDLAVASGLMPEGEALHHAISEALERADQGPATLEALEALAELAQRANPHLAIVVMVGPAPVTVPGS